MQFYFYISYFQNLNKNIKILDNIYKNVLLFYNIYKQILAFPGSEINFINSYFYIYNNVKYKNVKTFYIIFKPNTQQQC